MNIVGVMFPELQKKWDMAEKEGMRERRLSSDQLRAKLEPDDVGDSQCLGIEEF